MPTKDVPLYLVGVLKFLIGFSDPATATRERNEVLDDFKSQKRYQGGPVASLIGKS
jgi:hypothetical protein